MPELCCLLQPHVVFQFRTHLSGIESTIHRNSFSSCAPCSSYNASWRCWRTPSSRWPCRSTPSCPAPHPSARETPSAPGSQNQVGQPPPPATGPQLGRYLAPAAARLPWPPVHASAPGAPAPAAPRLRLPHHQGSYGAQLHLVNSVHPLFPTIFQQLSAPVWEQIDVMFYLK